MYEKEKKEKKIPLTGLFTIAENHLPIIRVYFYLLFHWSVCLSLSPIRVFHEKENSFRAAAGPGSCSPASGTEGLTESLMAGWVHFQIFLPQPRQISVHGSYSTCDRGATLTGTLTAMLFFFQLWFGGARSLLPLSPN